jgi:hypothetical protein
MRATFGLRALFLLVKVFLIWRRKNKNIYNSLLVFQIIWFFFLFFFPCAIILVCPSHTHTHFVRFFCFIPNDLWLYILLPIKLGTAAIYKHRCQLIIISFFPHSIRSPNIRLTFSTWFRRILTTITSCISTFPLHLFFFIPGKNVQSESFDFFDLNLLVFLILWLEFFFCFYFDECISLSPFTVKW